MSWITQTKNIIATAVVMVAALIGLTASIAQAQSVYPYPCGCGMYDYQYGYAPTWYDEWNMYTPEYTYPYETTPYYDPYGYGYAPYDYNYYYYPYYPSYPSGGYGAHCGGFIQNAPTCAAGYRCQLNPQTPDAGGTCVPIVY